MSRHLIAFSLSLLASQLAFAQVPSNAARVESLPTTVVLGLESVRLPQGERVGLVGGSVLFDIGGDWDFGPAVYGAATGRRGGFFVGGAELRRRWALAPGLSVATGLYAGGGGGAAAPVGSGLMLRPAITLVKDLGPSLQLGISLSSVRFPSGQIASSQLGLTLAWRNEFVHFSNASGRSGSSLDRATGLGFDRMSVTGSAYNFSDGSGRRIGLAGARAERAWAGDDCSWGWEAAAAAKGNAAGYMEILGTAACSTPVPVFAQNALRVGARLGAGLGGGGAVPTGGGLIGKAAATVTWRLAPGWTLGGEYGWVHGFNGSVQARQAQVSLGIDLEPRRAPRETSDGDAIVRTEWVGVWQHRVRAERRDGTRASLDTVGLKLNRYLGDHAYLSGQAHSAFAGGAGAYSVGLVGAGVVTDAQAPWRAGAELLVGAAGGGGVETAGGAITQGMVWTGWSTSPKSEWRAGVGALRGLRGGQASPLIELSWSRAFGLAGR